jgi:hypothetical protein
MTQATNSIGLQHYDAIVFKIGSTYYARKADGTLISSGSTAETVCQAAMNASGGATTSVLFTGIFTFSGSFTGLTIPRDCNVYCNAAQFVVPNGYTGDLWKVNSAWYGCVKGGVFYEAGTPARNWTCFNLNSDNAGMAFFEISHCYAYQPGRGIKLQANVSGSFVNACWFDNVFIDEPRVGVEFISANGGNLNNNTFDGVDIEFAVSTGLTTNGFKDLQGRNNTFVSCHVFDFDPAASECNILASNSSGNTSGIVIIGGQMTGHLGTFTDLASDTMIIDKVKKIYSKAPTTLDNYVELKGITAPGNPPSGKIRLYPDSADSNKIKSKRSDGTVIDLEAVGGASAHKDTHKSGGSDAFAKGDDLIAASRYLEDVSDPASDSQRFWLVDGGSLLKYWDDLGTPAKRTVLVEDLVQTVTSKVMSALDNTLKGVTQVGSKRVTGGFAGTNTSNDWALGQGTTTSGTTSDGLDNDGCYRQLNTGTTSGTLAGKRKTQFWARRNFNSLLEIIFTLTATTNARFYAGFKDSTTAITNDNNPLNNDSGVLIGFRDTDTNWQLIRNDGSATETFTDLGIAKDTTTRTIRISLSATNIIVQFTGLTPDQTLTTVIPAAATDMTYHVALYNTAPEDKGVKLRHVWIESDK